MSLTTPTFVDRMLERPDLFPLTGRHQGSKSESLPRGIGNGFYRLFLSPTDPRRSLPTYLTSHPFFLNKVSIRSSPLYSPPKGRYDGSAGVIRLESVQVRVERRNRFLLFGSRTRRVVEGRSRISFECRGPTLFRRGVPNTYLLIREVG